MTSISSNWLCVGNRDVGASNVFSVFHIPIPSLVLSVASLVLILEVVLHALIVCYVSPSSPKFVVCIFRLCPLTST